MGVERRKCRRLPVTLDVVLNHRAQTVVGTMRDISLEGAYLDLEPELLPYAGVVELAFSLPSETACNPIRLSAMIERTTNTGAAVRFGDIGRDAYFQLVDWVSHPPAAPAR